MEEFGRWSDVSVVGVINKDADRFSVGRAAAQFGQRLSSVHVLQFNSTQREITNQAPLKLAFHDTDTEDRRENVGVSLSLP